MEKVKALPVRQRIEMLRVSRHETTDFGVIVHFATGEALMRRGFAKEAKRRRFARDSGICIRLTEQGWSWVRE